MSWVVATGIRQWIDVGSFGLPIQCWISMKPGSPNAEEISETYPPLE